MSRKRPNSGEAGLKQERDAKGLNIVPEDKSAEVATPAALQVEQYVASRTEVEMNQPTFEQHEDLPEDLRDQLDLLGLHYWPECRAILCRVCYAHSVVSIKSKLCRDTVIPHLQQFHGFDPTLQARIFERCLGRLESLSQSAEGVRKPVPALRQRSFLEAPVNGWNCAMCDYATNDVRASEYHFKSRHHALLSWQKKPPCRVPIQRVDEEYFEVKGDLVVEGIPGEISDHEAPVIPEIVVDEADSLPDFLHHWIECHAIVCKGCDSRPVLCRITVVSHIREYHPNDDVLQDLEIFEHKLNTVEPLAQEPENIRLPNPWLGVQSFLQPPIAGYACSSTSCGWASEDVEKTKEHESVAHPKETQSSKRTQVMIQFVTLLDPVFFPVARFSDVAQDGPQFRVEIDTNESSDFQKYLNSVKATRGWDDEAEDISLWAPADGQIQTHGNIKVSSIADSNQTHRSIAGREFMDTYVVKERYDILASLWNSPKAEDLKPLSASETRSKIRNLVLRDKEAAVNEVKRFDTMFRQTLLATQHEIIELEEAISQGTHVPTEALRNILTEYASLVKSYQELLVIKQPGQKESRAFGRLLATELHEPRYWYAVDALDLIDLRIQVERGTHDIVRKYLQQKLPASFLDRVGKERRELDDIEAKKELPSGGMAKIIEAYRRHGRYISPSVDNFARILFALVGGIFLLAPMIVMAYITSTKYLLITTVLFVLFFAIILALSSKASNQELVAATAAYAAVLVVFVGNNIGPGSGSL